jgi:succinyl-CoA synthetase beta subunit
MIVNGMSVRRVLVEEAVAARQEIYAAAAVDRSRARVVLMTSAQGGVDIEDVARANREAIHEVVVDPCVGVRPYHTLALARAIGLGRERADRFGAVVRGLHSVLRQIDATLVEINPLALTENDDLVALDAKIVLDDNALYRHPNLAALANHTAMSARERAAHERGISFVEMGGDIGVIVNGAGLAMATMDVVKLFGGTPANFLDVGGGARAGLISHALHLVLAATGVRAVLVNIFGGITRCDEVAAGLVAALEDEGVEIPVVARLVGTNEAEGRDLLAVARPDVVTATDLVHAVRKVVEAASAEGQG